MKRCCILVFMALWMTGGEPVPAAESRCLPMVTVPLQVRIDPGAPVAALLQGGLELPLTLVDAASGRLLWSAGDASVATQGFPAMQAGFAGSLAAIDLDGDGVQDRLYAGDLAGRVWRFDVQHGAGAAAWLTGGLVADFSNDEGRLFIAAPDLSLSAPADAPPRLTLALGTAAPGNAAASNRFYVLYDRDVQENRTQEQYDELSPVTEADLQQVRATIDETSAASGLDEGPGWYVELGSGHVVTPSLTLQHRTVLALAPSIPREGSCEIFARIVTLDLEAGRIVVDDSADARWQVPLRATVRLSDAIQLQRVDETLTACSLGGQSIPGCALDTRPRRTWWRRADAP